MDKMDKIVALCKRRGFIFPGSEIYGGIGGFWDYGPLGVELKNNIKKEWWRIMVQARDDVVGLDAAIIMNPKVWEASGHVEAFTDPLIDCKNCKKRFRADKLQGWEIIKSPGGPWGLKIGSTICPSCGKDMRIDVVKTLPSGEKLTDYREFNLLVEAKVGVIEKTKEKVYLRGEITQGVFVNFRNVLDSTRIKIPFGIAQIGKAFRNEITPGNFTYRSREFEQMELEFFINPEEKLGIKWFEFWKNERMKWYQTFGMNQKYLRFRDHAQNEKAHYARFAVDIEYNAPFGWSEFEGIHHRGDWDLSAHKINYTDEAGNEFTPWVIETSGGVDRSALFFLLDAYWEDGKRIVLKLHPKLAPYKVAVFPLVSNKEEFTTKAKEIYTHLKKNFRVVWDDRGNIGKRYYAQDEIGTPWCVTVDYDTLKDDTVTVRDRDTTKQERIKVEKLVAHFIERLI